MPDFAVRTAFTATDKISPAFKHMGKNADVFGRKGSRAMSKVGGAGRSLLGGMKSLLPMFGVAAVASFAKASVKAFEVQEAAIANVEAGLKSTNNAIGITSKQLQGMASDIQKEGIFGDEEILQNVTAQMLTFGNIGKANFQRVQTAVVDVTAKLKGFKATQEDLRAQSIMLGKALDDPTRGMTALRRVGITFTKEESLMIKKLQSSNDMLGAQNMMLGLIEKKYGGVNKELSKTSAGMDRTAKMGFGDMMEVIGKQIVPLKRALLELAFFVMPKLNTGIPIFVGFLKKAYPLIKAIALGFVAWKVATLGLIAAQKAMAAAGMIKFLISYLPLIRKSIIAQGLFTTMLKGTSLWETILTAKTYALAAAQKVAAAGQWLLNAAMSANPIGLIIIGIAALIAIGVLLYKNWDFVKLKFQELWQTVGPGLKKLGGLIMTALLNPVNLLMTGIVKLLTLASKIPGIGGKFASAAASVSDLQNSMNTATGATKQVAPNKSQVQNSRVDFNGNIDINGAPQGSTASSKTKGSRPINMNLVGQN